MAKVVTVYRKKQNKTTNGKFILGQRKLMHKLGCQAIFALMQAITMVPLT